MPSDIKFFIRRNINRHSNCSKSWILLQKKSQKLGVV